MFHTSFLLLSISLRRFTIGFGFNDGGGLWEMWQLIKQSQDDGGDEVTWKISPVNERLRAITKNLPEAMRVLSDASKLNVSNFRLCSQKQAGSWSM